MRDNIDEGVILNFDLLKRSVIDTGFCCYCGMCSTVCPRISLDGLPKLIDYDPECSNCFVHCPQTNFPIPEIERKFFGQVRENKFLGYFSKCVVAKSTQSDILAVSQNGGVVTTLITHALETKLIDGAILTGIGPDWIPKPIVARTPQEIREAAGSKYSMAPTFHAFKEAVSKHELKKLAFVGMPCQIPAARKLQISNAFHDGLAKIEFVIGVFCHENFAYGGLLKEMVEKELGNKLSDIKKFDISKGKFTFSKIDGAVTSIPVKQLSRYVWPSCKPCLDFTAELADISIGSVGAPSNDWSAVLIRSDRGKVLFSSVVDAKKIVVKEGDEITNYAIPLIEKEARRKRGKMDKIIQEATPLLQLLGASQEEAIVYSTLIFLSRSDIVTLSKWTGFQIDSLKNILTSLSKKGWLMDIHGTFVPKDLSHVYQTKDPSFQEKLKEFEKPRSELEGCYMRKVMGYLE